MKRLLNLLPDWLHHAAAYAVCRLDLGSRHRARTGLDDRARFDVFDDDPCLGHCNCAACLAVDYGTDLACLTSMTDRQLYGAITNSTRERGTQI